MSRVKNKFLAAYRSLTPDFRGRQPPEPVIQCCRSRPTYLVLPYVVLRMSSDIEEKTTRVTRKGHVTIPKELREEFGFQEGDELRWEKTEDGIRVRKATQSAGRGMLVDDDIPEEKRKKMGRVAKRSRVCLWCSQLRGHNSFLFWWIAGAVRQGTIGSTLDQRTSPTEAGVSPLIPLLSSASTGSCSAC